MWLVAVAMFMSAPAVSSPPPGKKGHIRIRGSVEICALAGVPQATAYRIRTFLDQAATAANFALLNYDSVDEDYRLYGTLEALVAERTSDTRLVYAWEAYDKRGHQVRKSSGEITFPRATEKFNWDGVPSIVLKTIADKGFATVTNRPSS